MVPFGVKHEDTVVSGLWKWLLWSKNEVFYCHGPLSTFVSLGKIILQGLLESMGGRFPSLCYPDPETFGPSKKTLVDEIFLAVSVPWTGLTLFLFLFSADLSIVHGRAWAVCGSVRFEVNLRTTPV